MDSLKALAVLAFCAHAAALPQILPPLGAATTVVAGPATASAAAGVAVARPSVSSVSAPLPSPSLPVGGIPPLGASGVALPPLGASGAGLPGLSALPLPASPLGAVGGITGGANPINAVGGLAGGGSPLNAVSGVASGASPLSAVSGVAGGASPVNAVSGLLGGASPLSAVSGLTGGASPVNAVSGLTSGGSPLNVVSGLAGGASPLNTVSGLAGGASPLDTVTGLAGGAGAVSGALGTVPNAVGSVGGSLPVPLPDLPLPGSDSSSDDPLKTVVKLGTTVLSLILDILSKGASLIPLPGASGLVHSLPVGALPNGSLPLSKRQLGPLTGGLTSGSSPLGVVGGVAGTVTNAVGGVPVVGSAAAPVLSTVGGATSGTNPLGAVSGAVGTATNAVGGVANSVPVAGPVVSGAVGSVAGGSSPLSGVANTVAGVANSVPVAGPVVGGVVNSLPVVGQSGSVSSASSNPNLNPAPFQGIPGVDPVGSFSISVIATLLSLLKKDPLSLFAPSLPIPALVKRDLPELHKRGIPELAKRQLSGLPSLSTGLPGIGVGALPLSGVPGVPPDLAFLVGTIAKNLALPGGNGIGSITNNILGVLNGVVPNFLFQLPVVQDSVPTFGVLQLLSSINPSKFGSLGSLTSLAALQQAASGISAGDIAFIRTLPVSPDPSNLITTIITLSDNILSLPGNVANLKAAVSVLCMKNLGLSVLGL